MSFPGPSLANEFCKNGKGFFCSNSEFITAMDLKLSQLQHQVVFYLWWKFQINRVIFREVMGSELRKMGIFLYFSYFTPKNENRHISVKSDSIELNFHRVILFIIGYFPENLVKIRHSDVIFHFGSKMAAIFRYFSEKQK